jgi:RHS repeat-associated protein
MEALKGLPIATEKRDLAGHTLSTDVTQYELRKLYEGRDGRGVRQAVAVATQSYVYDTSAAVTEGGTVTATVNRRDLVAGANGGASTAGAPEPLITKVVPLRSSAYALISGSSESDFFGNQVVAVKYGCTTGCNPADETLTQVTVPGRPANDGTGLLFRTVASWTTGSAHGAERYGYQSTEYNEYGNSETVKGYLSGTVPVLPGKTLTTPETEGEFTASETLYDLYGNPTKVTGPNGRCSEVSYDSLYGQLPVTETLYRKANCSDPIGMQASAYDRGLGLVTIAVDINGQSTKVEYDGFGRTVALYKPQVNDSKPSEIPSVKIEYFLPPSLGSNVSAIHTMTEDGATAGDGNYLESWAFVDGFGRTRTTLTEADPDKDVGDGHNWVVSGLVTHDAKGAVQRKHVEYFYDGSPQTFSLAAAPSTPYGSQRYDAFGRAIQTFDLDGTMTLKTVYHALSTDLWDAADSSPGPHAGTYASARKDGHGRAVQATERAHAGGQIQERHIITEFNPAGQAEVIRRRKGNDSSSDVVRTMQYDSLGRMVLNIDPHTTAGTTYTPSDALKTWRYQYNLAGDLIATEDARGCGVNFAYDALGRLLGEDYVPCETANHQDYSAPNTDGTSGWEVKYYYDSIPGDGPKPPDWNTTVNHFTTGRLVAVRDRASETWTDVDGRGHVIMTARRVAKPATVDSAGKEIVPDVILERYTNQWFEKQAEYDVADRVVAETVGGIDGTAPARFSGMNAEVFEAPNRDDQTIRTNYSRRGVVQSVDGSYGSLVSRIKRRADGLVENLVYGDAAGTTTATTYDDRRRPTNIISYRGAPTIWSALGEGVTYLPMATPTAAPSSFQLLLEDTSLTYDEVGNPTEIRDWREPSEWPAGSKPVTKKVTYDDLYRATRIDYQYSTDSGTDSWKSPFEQENTESDDTRDKRRAKPVPQLQFTNRPLSQRYEYDWLGNVTESDDDAHGIWDRSLGDQKHENNLKPYQFTSANNSSQKGSGQGHAGTVVAKYDDAGNMTRLGVVRPIGACLPGSSPCTQEYVYNWDEVGRLVRSRRYDSYSSSVDINAATPAGTLAIDLRHRYDASDNRVIKRDFKTAVADQRHSLYVFGSFEVRRTTYVGNAYTVDLVSAVPYAMANGVRLARLHYGLQDEPKVSGVSATAPGWTGTAPQLHVLLELGDHLGSTSTVLDKATGELVEKASYLAYGAEESDYRTERWEGFREDYGFTGKEEDVEVGLVYFGKRFLSPQLGRWVSADPLAVHAPGKADFNLYAYVSGAVLKSVDPVGLVEEAATGNEILEGFSHWLPGATTVEGHLRSVRGAGGVVNYIATHAKAYKYPTQARVHGTWVNEGRAKLDKIESGLYMDARIWTQLTGPAMLGSTSSRELQKESIRLAIHESFHGYQGLRLNNDADFRSLYDIASSDYAKQTGIKSTEETISITQETHAEYFALRATAYARANSDLMSARESHSLTQAKFDEIRQVFNSTLKELDKGIVKTYTTGDDKNGNGTKTDYTVQINAGAKTFLDDLSGVASSFDNNAGLNRYSNDVSAK